MYSAIEALEKTGQMRRFCEDHNVIFLYDIDLPSYTVVACLRRPGSPTLQAQKCFAAQQVFGDYADPERLLQQLETLAAEFDKQSPPENRPV